MSHPKPDSRICDHNRYVNIKPKLGINKNQVKFFKSFFLSFHLCFFTFFFFENEILPLD